MFSHITIRELLLSVGVIITDNIIIDCLIVRIILFSCHFHSALNSFVHVVQTQLIYVGFDYLRNPDEV